jgi:hypothetical protein
MSDWLISNKEITAAILIVFATIIAAIIGFIKKDSSQNASTNTINNNINLSQSEKQKSQASSINKDTARILFVDDDTSFQVVKILRKAGWQNVKAIKDVTSLDSQTVVETDIFFVDIQGVGKALKFNDEGLGLALALKNKYPHKKLVIYSAEPRGDRFHQAFRVADDFLSKTAEPYEFQQVVDNLLLT